MGFVAHAERAAAVSNAGGMGCIGSGSMSSHELKEQISRCRDLTDRPFGVDILFAEIKADKTDSTVVRYSSNVQCLIDITFEANIPVIVSELGNPPVLSSKPTKTGGRNVPMRQRQASTPARGPGGRCGPRAGNLARGIDGMALGVKALTSNSRSWILRRKNAGKAATAR
jgi:hypothetical protein